VRRAVPAALGVLTALLVPMAAGFCLGALWVSNSHV
jgi:hypothetical protein